MKRFIAILMAMIIVLSLGVAAFAGVNTDRTAPCKCLQEVWVHDTSMTDQPLTCTQDGIEYLMCSNKDADGNPCPGRATRTTEALGHDYVEQITVEPTCTTEGHSIMICTRCGEPQPDSGKTIPAKGHTFVTKKETVEPATYEKDGKAVVIEYCSVCEYEKSKTEEPIPKYVVSGLAIAPTAVSVKVGATVSLTPLPSFKGASAPTITWSSDDPSIATVNSDGVVTGVAEGPTIIRASAPGEITATASVTVTKADPPKELCIVYYHPDAYSIESDEYKCDPIEAGRTFSTLPKKYTRSGYVQTGWVTSSGKAYALDTAGYPIYSDLHLYPSWTRASNVYTVRVSYSGDLANSGGYIYDSVHGRYYEGESFTMRSDESRSFYVSCNSGYYAFSVKTVGGAGYHNHGSVSNGSYFTVRNPAENKTLFVRFENKTYYPPTGDESNLGLFAALALMSVLGCAAVVTVKKHEH